MLIDQYAGQLAELEDKFHEYKKDLSFIQEEIFDKIDHTLITKGTIANITPFYEERLGERLKGKVISSPILSDDCMKYHYDKDERIIAIERYDTFLRRFVVEELFNYREDLTERLRLDNERLVRLFVFDHAFGHTERCFSYGDLHSTGGEADEYIYGEMGLQEICRGRREGDYKETFFYEGDKLAMIEMTWPNGSKRLIYTTKRPNFQRLREETYYKMKNVIESFPDSYSALGVECFLDQREPTLYLCVTGEPQPSALIADWQTDMVDVQIYDWQLDDQQLTRCVKMVAEILVELVDEGILKGKQIFFHQFQTPVMEQYAQARRVFQKAGLLVK